ncbi:MAG: hypothetical protein ACRDJE_19015 [Dehalococcoidia bacterium]
MADWKRSIPRSELWGGCGACVHFRKDTTCLAFPRRIPIQIASGEIDHLVVRPGQAGTTIFESKPVREPVPQPS